MMIEDNKVYSAQEIAAELRIGKDKVYRMAKKGILPSVKIDKTSPLRFTGWSIKQWLDMQTQKTMKGET